MFNKTITAACAAAILMAGAAGTASAAPESVYTLAARPICAVIGGTVVVRGAVAMDDTRLGVPGARVELKYGNAVQYATTDGAGVYVASFPASAATHVQEVATWVDQTGSHVPTDATNGSGGCTIPAVKLGRPAPVK